MVVSEIPSDMTETANEWREKMLEKIATEDEFLFEKYLEKEDITREEIVAVIRRATVACKIIPVLCGTALKKKGVQLMLDAVCDYLPSPIDIHQVEGTDTKSGDTIVRKT